MRGVAPRAHAHRSAGLHVVVNVLHLFVGETAEAGQNDHEIGRFKILQAGNVAALVGIDLAGLGINGEQHRALEAMMLRQDLRQLRQGLFGAILFIATDQHNVFAGTRAVATGELDPLVIGLDRNAAGEQKH